MAVPAGGEIAIYNAAAKTAEWRVVTGLDYPLWSGTKSEAFSGALDPLDFRFTRYENEPPDVSGGSLNIRSYGGPPREMVWTRPHWMPLDPTLAFKITINAAFPEADPVYSPSFVVGQLESRWGQDGDILRVVQMADANAGGSVVGETWMSSAGVFGYQKNNDAGALVVYDVQWDPNGTPKLEVFRNSVSVFSTSDAEVAVRPFFIAFGYMWGQRTDVTDLDPESGRPNPFVAPGTPAEPVTTLQVFNVIVDQFNAEGFESRVYPGWTSANAGGDLDTAVDGERFSLDGETWAKIPLGNIQQVLVTGGRDQATDQITVTLNGADETAPDTTKHIFNATKFQNRPMLLDTRVADDAGSFTAWKRQGVFIIDDVRSSGPFLQIAGRDRPMSRLDTLVQRTYLTHDRDNPDAQADGEIEGISLLNAPFNEVLEDLVAVADDAMGGVLGAIATNILSPTLSPVAITSGGQSLAATFNQWCDRLALECWRKYRVTGVERYGELRTNLWSVTGTAGYTFRGEGASAGNQNVLPPGVELTLNRRSGVSMVSYKQDSPAIERLSLGFAQLDNMGVFPSAPYPPNDRALSDSVAYIAGFGSSVMVTWPDATATNVTGGIARHRMRLENSRRRRATIRVTGHDWIEPTDVVAIDDPDHSGVASTEAWIVDSRSLTIDKGAINSVIVLSTTDWVTAVTAGL